jgi:CTP-dependent riboflavin kinase
MELTVLERVRLLSILPPKGNILTMTTVAEIRKKVSFSAQESADIGMESDGTEVRWSENKAAIKKIEFEAGELVEIKEALRELNTKCKATLNDITLYNKFMNGGE